MIRKLENRNHDIDSLRFFSVLIVLLYHFEFRVFEFDLIKSGYIGVDIFFFISGYILSKIYLNKNTNLKKYTSNRIKRIYPAFLLVLIISNIAIFFLPYQLSKYLSLQSLFSAIGTLNYFFIIQDVNYFSDEIYYLTPFKHLWSLSIEINFYILFILIIFIYKKFNLNIFLNIVLIFILVSLFYSNYITYKNINIGYFDTFSRLWEFLSGIYFFKISSLFKFNKINDLIIKNAKMLSYLCLIYMSQFYDNYNHPNFKTLLIILFCIVITFPNKDDFINEKLMKVILFFSKISYSIFLIHLPILYFFNLLELNNSLIKIILILLIILLSYFSYQKIEKKFIE